MASAAFEIQHIPRRIGHSVITWRIEHFSLAACVERTEIKGPEFKIRGPFITRWLPTLTTMVKAGNIHLLTLRIERLAPDNGPEMVYTDIRLSLMDQNNVEFADIDYEYYFDYKTVFNADLLSMDYILGKFPAFTTDTLIGRIQMLVYSEESVERAEKFTDADVRSLTFDLRLLYKCSRFCDTVIETDGKSLKAHKAILDARCPILAKAMDGADPVVAADVCKLDRTSLDKIISFLYSGNLDFLVGKPTIQVYECGKYLRLDDVMLQYHPDECEMFTTLDVEEFVFEWTIADFCGRDEKCLVSPPLNKWMSSCVWRLKLYPRGSGKNVGFVSVFAEVVEGFRPQRVTLEFGVLDANREVLYPVRLRKFMETDEMLGFESFVKREYLENPSVLANNMLRITFKLRSAEPSSDFTSVLHGQAISITTVTDHQETYLHLKNDMERMLERKRYCNINLEVEGTIFEAHRYILSCRSATFTVLLQKFPVTETDMTLTNIKAPIFRKLLYYLYCAKVPRVEPEELLDYYTAAETFKVSTLKDFCSRMLQSSLTVENVVQTVAFSEAICDRYLTTACIRFIQSNKDAVYQHDSWRNFVETKPELSRVIQATVETQ